MIDVVRATTMTGTSYKTLELVRYVVFASYRWKLQFTLHRGVSSSYSFHAMEFIAESSTTKFQQQSALTRENSLVI